jgi:hypothetical protein
MTRFDTFRFSAKVSRGLSEGDAASADALRDLPKRSCSRNRISLPAKSRRASLWHLAFWGTDGGRKRSSLFSYVSGHLLQTLFSCYFQRFFLTSTQPYPRARRRSANKSQRLQNSASPVFSASVKFSRRARNAPARNGETVLSRSIQLGLRA